MNNAYTTSSPDPTASTTDLSSTALASSPAETSHRFPAWLSDLFSLKALDRVDALRLKHSSKADGSSVEHHDVEEEDLSESDEEEEPVAEQIATLLWESQLKLVNHQPRLAIVKLERAHNLGSSSAALTLGNLFARGLNDSYSSPASSPISPLASMMDSGVSHNSNHLVIADSLTAAGWFLRALELETLKIAEPEEGMDMKRGEEESHEGVHLRRERVLDIVIGLTDAYRFGILRPDPANSLSDRLWKRGAELAQVTLLHPGVALPLRHSANRTSSMTSPTIRPGSISIPASLGPRNSFRPTPTRTNSTSPRRTPTARAFDHPASLMSTLLPSSTTTPTHLSPSSKLQLAIQLHLHYLLALKSWSNDRSASELYWKEILRLAADVGGVVGTKEGEEIVLKATRRLKQIDRLEVRDDWKLSKLASRLIEQDIDLSRSNDALSGIWRLKNGTGTEADHLERDGYNPALLVSEIPTKAMMMGPADGRVQSNLAGSRPSSSKGPTSDLHKLDTSTTTTRSFNEKRSKFHFAPEEYRSPPASPPLDSATSTNVSPNVNSVSPASSRSSTTTAPPPIRRKYSTLSFRPPPLIFRVKSSASVSTLPPDFFSAKSRSVTSPTWTHNSPASLHAISSHATGSSRLNPNTVFQDGAKPSWASSLRSRAANSSVRVVTNLRAINPFRQEKPSAMTILKTVLTRDENCGMYWSDGGDPELVETDEEDEISAPTVVASKGAVPVVFVAKRSTRSSRAFVDPTSAGSTGPTTTLSGKLPRISQPIHLHAPITSSPLSPILSPASVSPMSPHNPSRFPLKPRLRTAESSIDPVLLALEKASRVGVKTRCASCGTKGFNFPACPRCNLPFCSRECRVTGGGDGRKHVCGRIVG